MKRYSNILLLLAFTSFILTSCKKTEDSPAPAATVNSPSYANYLWVQQNISSKDSIYLNNDTIYFQSSNHENGDVSSSLLLNQALKGDFELSVSFSNMMGGADGSFSMVFTNKVFFAPSSVETIFSLGVDNSFSNIFPRYHSDTASLTLSYRSADHGKMVVKRAGNVMEVSISNPDAAGNSNWFKKTYTSTYTGDLYCTMGVNGKAVFNIKVADITLKDATNTTTNISIDPAKRGYWKL